jgi:hypothetical protein
MLTFSSLLIMSHLIMNLKKFLGDPADGPGSSKVNHGSLLIKLILIRVFIWRITM